MPAPTIVAMADVPGQGNSIAANYTTLGVQNGDVIFWACRSQGTPVADVVPPTGWARAGTVGAWVASDRFLGIFYKAIPTASSDSLNYTFTGTAGGRLLTTIGVIRGADLAHLNDGGQKYQTSATITAGTAGAAPYTVLAFWGAEFTAGNSAVPSAIPSGFTLERNTQTTGGDPATILVNTNTTASRTGIVLASKKVESGSLTIPALTTTWSGTATDAKAASWAIRGIAGSAPVGVPVKTGTGAVAGFSYLDGSGVRKVPASIRMTLPPFTVTNMLAKPGVTMGHRGASAVTGMPEMSRRAYRYAATQRGYRVLEFSCNVTSDGVYVGVHDNNLNRTSQTTGLPSLNTITWAEVQAYNNSLNSSGTPAPYYRLEDFLDEFATEATVHVDPKFNMAGMTPFLNILDAHVGNQRAVLKFVGVGVGPDALADAARLRGYLTATYAYEADWSTGALHASQAHWDILGMEYTASTNAWARTTVGAYPGIRSYGKPVLAHILPDQTAYNTAKTKIEEGGWVTAGGTWIAQVSGVNAVAAVA